MLFAGPFEWIPLGAHPLERNGAAGNRGFPLDPSIRHYVGYFRMKSNAAVRSSQSPVSAGSESPVPHFRVLGDGPGFSSWPPLSVHISDLQRFPLSDDGAWCTENLQSFSTLATRNLSYQSSYSWTLINPSKYAWRSRRNTYGASPSHSFASILRLNMRRNSQPDLMDVTMLPQAAKVAKRVGTPMRSSFDTRTLARPDLITEVSSMQFIMPARVEMCGGLLHLKPGTQS